MQPSTHKVGFTVYEVVPDDIKDPLTSNQLYQSQYNELVKFKLAQFNVVPDDIREPLLVNQMRPSQYNEVQRGWLRMNNGQGLVLQGSDTDQEIFKEKLSYGLSHSVVFRKLFTDIANNPAQNVQVDIGRNQPNVLLDAFEYEASTETAKRNVQTIDLADLEQSPIFPPDAHPDAMTQIQNLIHTLEEARVGAKSSSTNPSERYQQGHQAGIALENLYRLEQGQGGILQTEPVLMKGGYQWTYSNGHQEIWLVTGDQISGIIYP
jgi:hypothetical protein